MSEHGQREKSPPSQEKMNTCVGREWEKKRRAEALKIWGEVRRFLSHSNSGRQLGEMNYGN